MQRIRTVVDGKLHRSPSSKSARWRYGWRSGRRSRRRTAARRDSLRTRHGRARRRRSHPSCPARSTPASAAPKVMMRASKPSPREEIRARPRGHPAAFRIRPLQHLAFRSSHGQSSNFRRCCGGRAGRHPRRDEAAPGRRRCARRSELDEAAIKLRDIPSPPLRPHLAAAATRRAPPPESVSGPRSVSTTMSQLCGPVWRKSNSAVDRQAVDIGQRQVAPQSAPGDWPGKTSSAAVTNSGCGRILVRIESALMPGSNTPSPPGSQIQPCPGCQTRTSSFQLMCTELMRHAASHCARRLDRGRKARMPGREQRSLGLAPPSRSADRVRLTPRPAAFPASRACRPRAPPPPGHAAPAAACRASNGIDRRTFSNNSSMVAKCGRSGSEALRLATAASVTPSVAAMAPTC